MKQAQINSAVGSLLFIYSHPITIKTIAKIIGANQKQIKKALAFIADGLKPMGLVVINSHNKFQLATDSINAKFVKKLIKFEENTKIGQASLEVLTVIAYKKGITKEEIEIIRGINSTRAIRNLMIKGLIQQKSINGIKKYFTTLKFLKILGIKKLEELPDWEKFHQNKEIKELLAFNNQK